MTKGLYIHPDITIIRLYVVDIYVLYAAISSKLYINLKKYGLLESILTCVYVVLKPSMDNHRFSTD